VWDDFLGFAVNKALDYGVDCSTVLDQVAFTISRNPTPAFEDAARIADLLLTHLDISDARQMPSELFDFVNDVLHSTYPPEPRNKITSSWLLRSLTRAIDACPVEFALNLLEAVQDGVSLWISDSYRVFTEQEYEDEVMSMIDSPVSLADFMQTDPSHVPNDSVQYPITSAYSRDSGNRIHRRGFRILWPLRYANLSIRGIHQLLERQLLVYGGACSWMA
jgi:hypothetical protein